MRTVRGRLDNIINNTKKEKIREQLYQRLAPYVLPILNTEIGKAVLQEDIDRFLVLFENLINGEWENIKVENFIEMKYLHNRILTSSKRIAKYLELEK
jgi:hypothetical protein